MTHRLPAVAPALLGLAAAIALIGCGPKAEPTIKIGHVAPMTGPQAHLGKDNENGARLAIEELNAKGLEIGGAKVKFELIAEDDQADPKQGTLVAQKFVDAKVHGVIGHLNSGTTIPASKIYADAGIPQISGSATNPTYTNQGFKTAYRVMANDVQQGKALGEFAAKLGIKTVAIIDDRTAYGKGLADEFNKAAVAAGLQVVATEYTDDKAVDFKAILTNIKAANPEMVFYGGMDAQGGPLVKQAAELGISSKFLTGDGGCTPEFIKLGGAATENQYCSLPGVPLGKMPKGPAFKQKFTEKFKGEIQLYAPYVYDAVMVMADAMVRANSTEPAKYLAVLPATSYAGVTATVQFDGKGDLKDGAISLYQAKDGKWAYLETLGATQAAPAAAAPAAAATPAPAPK
ncbi:MAG: hypothetical protein RIR00_1138 [Pseudomonadota bacterium]|jgi:branched-chain amino acid transport system substrate-binding protein